MRLRARSRHLATLKAKGRRTTALFAEALAEGKNIGEAAAAAGVCRQRGSQLLKRIRKELGWQAQ
jgi:hypothetical protein